MRQLLFLGAFCLLGLPPNVGAACTDSFSRAEALRFDREGGFTALLAPDGDVVAFNQERPWLHSTGRASWLATAPVVDLRPGGRVLTVEAPPQRESTPGCYVPEWRISAGSLSGGPRSTLRWDPRGLEPTSAIYLSPSGHFATLTAARVHDMEGSQAIVFDLRRRRVVTSIAASDVAWGEGDMLLVIDENRERIEAHRRTARGWAGASVYQSSRPDGPLSFVNEAAGKVVAFERGARSRLLVWEPADDGAAGWTTRSTGLSSPPHELSLSGGVAAQIAPSEVLLLDIESGRRLARIAGGNYYSTVALSSAGDRVAVVAHHATEYADEPSMTGEPALHLFSLDGSEHFVWGRASHSLLSREQANAPATP
ncbi:MAG: hypothetical protein RID81_32235 [Sandaracinaceae bacterium]